MKLKITAAALLLAFAAALCACSVTPLDGVPADRINPISDAAFIEPQFVNHAVTRLLYEQLSPVEQLFYRHFYNCVFSHPEYIAVPSGIDGETVKRVFVALKYDNPHLLCLKNSYRLMTFGDKDFVRPDYAFSAKTCGEKTHELDVRASALTGNAKQFSGDFGKEVYLHDELIKGCTYDGTKTMSTAYDALIAGRSACGGYAMGMKLLLDKAGIKSAAVSGSAGTDGEKAPHMWLCVNADGEWYHLDPTWDDPVGAEMRTPLHGWFNVTSEAINATHSDYTLPKNVRCNSVQGEYYNKKGLFCDGNNDAAVIEKSLKNAFADGNFAEIKYRDGDEMKLAAAELFEDGGIDSYLKSVGYPEETRVSYTENTTMSVLYIYVHNREE